MQARNEAEEGHKSLIGRAPMGKKAPLETSRNHPATGEEPADQKLKREALFGFAQLQVGLTVGITTREDFFALARQGTESGEATTIEASRRLDPELSFRQGGAS